MFAVTCFWVVVVKNGCSVLDHTTLKSAIYISQEWIDELSNFLHADTNLGKLNVNLIFIGWAWPELGKTFQIIGL